MRRYADTFFRFWGIALVPVLLLPLGAVLLMRPGSVAYGVANIWVTSASLQQLSYADPGLPPAQNMANYLNQFLLSPSFDLKVAARSPMYSRSLTASPDAQNVAEADLSKNAVATANGSNLVTISYMTKNAAIAQEVVRSILNASSHEIAVSNQLQSSKDIAYYKGQFLYSRARYASTAKSLGSYMSTHGISSNEINSRQLTDPGLASLYQEQQAAQTDLNNVQQQISRLRGQQTANVALRIIDQPSAKVTTNSKKKQLTTLAIPLVLGLLLSAAFIVTKTVLDRSVRYADEVPDLLALPVLAVVPYSAELAGQHGRNRGVKATILSLAGKG